MTLRVCASILAAAMALALPGSAHGGEARLTSALNELEADLQIRFSALPPLHQGTSVQERLRTLLPGMIRSLGLGSRTAAEELEHVKNTLKFLPKLLPDDPDLPPLLGRTLDGFQEFLQDEADDIADWLTGIGEPADGKAFRLLNAARGRLEAAATESPFTSRQKALVKVDRDLQAVDNAVGIVKFSPKHCPIKTKPGPGEYARASLISRSDVGQVNLIFFAHTLARSAQRDSQGNVTRLDMEFHYCT